MPTSQCRSRVERGVGTAAPFPLCEQFDALDVIAMNFGRRRNYLAVNDLDCTRHIPEHDLAPRVILVYCFDLVSFA